MVQFHPVQPWIAFADKSDMVKVWDWSTQQVRGMASSNVAALVLCLQQHLANSILKPEYKAMHIMQQHTHSIEGVLLMQLHALHTCVHCIAPCCHHCLQSDVAPFLQ